MTMDQWNFELLPFECLRCGKKYFAGRRDLASCPLVLCVGCFTALMFRSDHADIPRDEPLGDFQQFRSLWAMVCENEAEEQGLASEIDSD